MWKTGILLVYLLILSIFDCRERKVPIALLLGGVLGLCLLIFVEMGCGTVLGEELGRLSLRDAWREWLLGALPGVFLVLVAVLTRKAGVADGVVLMEIGICLGYRITLLLLCISLMLMSLLCVPLLLMRRVKRKTELPYLPFLTGALLLWNCFFGM